MEARSRSTNSKRRIQKVKDLNRSRNNLKCASPPLDRETQLSCKCWTALEQSNDLIQLQDILLRNSLKKQKEISGKSQLGKEEYQEICRQLDAERVEHTKTKCLLSAEQEKAQLAVTEINVLTKQLSREKSTFEKAFGLLKSQALSDSSKSESLLAKCTALETLNTRKDETILRLEAQVNQLTQQIKEMKQSHKMELQEANVRMQQEIYLTRHFRELEPSSKGSNSIARGRAKIKLKKN